MNPLLTARQQLAAALEAEESLLGKLVSENRDATEEEKAELEKCAATKKRCQDYIAHSERLEQERQDFERSNPAPVGANGSMKLAPRVEIIREEGEDEHGRYRPFRSFGEQLQAVRRAAATPHNVDRRLTEMNKRAAAGLNETVGADGGFLVQVDFNSELMRLAIETGILASRCRRFPVSPNATGVEFPVLEETSRADGSRWGGVQVYWAAEAEQAQKSKPKFSIQRLTFQKLLGLCVVTDEMLNDAPFLGSFVTQAFQEEFAYKIDDGIIRGTGAGQMLGILNSGCLVTASKETSQAADTIVGMNVVKMRARLLARARQNAVWLTNQDCEPQIQTLTITKEKSDIPLYSPADGIARPLDTILARPVLVIEQASTLGDVGDLILADLSYYALIMRDMNTASSIHVYFDTEQTAFRFSLRINGQPMIKQAITPARGTNTLSPFVALEAR